MIYLKTYDNFNNTTYAVGDVVLLSDDNITKSNKNSYIVDIVKNNQIIRQNVEVRYEAGDRL